MFKAFRKPKNRLPPARGARAWSNIEISKICSEVSGKVVNVSAWLDEDKEGRHYRDYFPKATSYSTTNFEGWRGEDVPSDYVLDLEKGAPDELKLSFDFVLNHTTLEHVFDVHTAFSTLCDLSSDAVLVVVPFIQHLHGPEDGDFWRISPYALRRLFQTRGFQVIHESAGPEGGNVRYLLQLGTRDPEKWKGKLPQANSTAEKILRQPISS